MRPESGDARTTASYPQGPDVSRTVLDFERPIYIQGLTVEVIVLTATIAACVVTLTPVNALITSAVGLVLAVWGVRGILLGTLAPSLSTVDMALALVVILVLIATMTRIMWLFEPHSRLRMLSRLPGMGVMRPSSEPAPAPVPGDFLPRAPSHGGSDDGWWRRDSP
jgi:hypothetical protein